MDRRTFFNWVGVGLLASSLPVSIAALLVNTESLAKAASGNFRPVGKVNQLNQQGQLLAVLGAYKVLVIPDPNKPLSLLAVNPVCTYRSCGVEWKIQQRAFVCPCHGCRFAADGKVLQGPASVALQTFKAKIEGDQIWVSQ
ncbi:ubiquinol-cytochrome c reductase iron-sulfur subunit [Floridanema evergladense]|uniref:Ubiquinol-cytochrome c reductase iron-sulfur subunit n=1 Tax=Floridaenema evergladense BLCC-F167 TaxID=3153639 RepID=A0ABV4WKZ2_9CYAN